MTWGCRIVDVSSNQPSKAVPWAALRDSGVEAAILRACVGLGRDDALLEHANRARAGGVDVLALYGVLYPKQSVAAQVDLLCQALLAVGSVAPVLDLELTHDRSALEVSDLALEYVDGVESATGLDCLVYTYPAFADLLPLPQKVATRRLWVAHYKKLAGGAKVPDPRVDRPRVPEPWDDWLIWQHDGDGGLKAPNGLDLDFNVCRLSLPDLRALLVPPADAALGSLAGSVRAAEGRGESVEDFISRDEGPVIR